MTTTKKRRNGKREPRETARTVQPAVSTTALQQKVVLLIVTIHAPGNNRRVNDKSILNTEADKDLLRISKRLIEAAEHRTIQTLDGQIRQYVRSMALPSPFKEGVYALPIDLLERVDAKLVEFDEQRREKVQELKAVYADIVQKSRERLGGLWKQSDYLTEQQLDDAYSLGWQYVTISAPDEMRFANFALFKREQERLERQWQEAITDMRSALRLGLTELVGDLVDRLTDATIVNDRQGDLGKIARIYPGKLLGRFEEFLSTFNARNVTGDAQLEALADQARNLLKGVDPEKLKAAQDIRERVKEGFEKVRTQLDKLEVESRDANSRRIRFDDE